MLPKLLPDEASALERLVSECREDFHVGFRGLGILPQMIWGYNIGDIVRGVIAKEHGSCYLGTALVSWLCDACSY